MLRENNKTHEISPWMVREKQRENARGNMANEEALQEESFLSNAKQILERLGIKIEITRSSMEG